MRQSGVDLTAVLVLLVVGVPLGVLWALAAADVLKRADSEFPSYPWGSSTRIVWTYVVLFFAGIGALLYYVQVMRPYPRERR